MDVTTIFWDKSNNIWLTGKQNGIAIFHPEIQTIENVAMRNRSCQQLINNPVFSLCEDNQRNILATVLGKGLYSINRQTYDTHELNVSMNNPTMRLAICMIKDHKNRIWIGTDGNGLWILDDKNNKLLPYDSPNLGFDSMKGKVQALYEDKQGNIWVTYAEKGMMIIPATNNTFQVIQSNPFNGLDFSDQSVTALLMDQEKNLRVGTNGGGLFQLKNIDNSFQLENKVNVEETVITSLFQDSQGYVYIGTYLHSFYRYDIKTKKMENFEYSPDNSRSINCNHATGFAEEQTGKIYIATNGGGINAMGSRELFNKRLA